MTTTGLVCAACGIELPPNSKFCNECGAAISAASKSAEYKQVTVLFADVVRSMDIATAVGAERLREIMAQLVDSASVVVQRYGGTVDKFTGDGIMAVFHRTAAKAPSFTLFDCSTYTAVSYRSRERKDDSPLHQPVQGSPPRPKKQDGGDGSASRPPTPATHIT